MSRSHKKNPIIKDKTGMKKYANRKVRRYKKEIPNGTSYKQLFNSYDISDFSFSYTYNEYKKEYESRKKSYINGAFPYLRDDYSYYDWYKTYLKK